MNNNSNIQFNLSHLIKVHETYGSNNSTSTQASADIDHRQRRRNGICLVLEDLGYDDDATQASSENQDDIDSEHY